MDYKKARKLIYWLAGIGTAVLLLGAWAQRPAFMAPGVALVISTVFVNLKYWRCPHCGGHLGRDIGRYCMHCGKELEDLRD